MRKRRKRATRLRDCSVKIEMEGSKRGVGGGGWRFVRLRSERDLGVGWGVYEFWVVGA
jgi:hypothetical protein